MFEDNSSIMKEQSCFRLDNSVRWTGTVTLEIADFSARQVSRKVPHFSYYLCKTLRNRKRIMFFLIGLFYWQLMDLDVKYLDVFFTELIFDENFTLW